MFCYSHDMELIVLIINSGLFDESVSCRDEIISISRELQSSSNKARFIQSLNQTFYEMLIEHDREVFTPSTSYNVIPSTSANANTFYFC